jgi:hypothetical protein
MPGISQEDITIEVALPGLETKIVQTLRQRTLDLPQACAGLEGASPVKIRSFEITGDLTVYHALCDSLVTSLLSPESSAVERDMALAAIFMSVWSPGQRSGQRLQANRRFSWKLLERFPKICNDLNLKTDRYGQDLLALKTGDEQLLMKTEGEMLKVFKTTENLAEVAGRELVHQDALTSEPYPEVYRALLEEVATVVTREGPVQSTPSPQLSRRLVQSRLRDFSIARGWTREQIQGALWQARMEGQLVLPVANAQILTAIKEPLHVWQDECDLFEFAHVRSYALRPGATLLPVLWDPVLRSLFLSMSLLLQGKLVYVCTQPPNSYPDAWRNETAQMICAYLMLYGRVVRELRETEKPSGRQAQRETPVKDITRFGLLNTTSDEASDDVLGLAADDTEDGDVLAPSDDVRGLAEDDDSGRTDALDPSDAVPETDGDDSPQSEDALNASDDVVGSDGDDTEYGTLNPSDVPEVVGADDPEGEEEAWNLVKDTLSADRNPKLLAVFEMTRKKRDVETVAASLGLHRTQVGRLLDRGLRLLVQKYRHDRGKIGNLAGLWNSMGLGDRVVRVFSEGGANVAQSGDGGQGPQHNGSC